MVSNIISNKLVINLDFIVKMNIGTPTLRFFQLPFVFKTLSPTRPWSPRPPGISVTEDSLSQSTGCYILPRRSQCIARPEPLGQNLSVPFVMTDTNEFLVSVKISFISGFWITQPT